MKKILNLFLVLFPIIAACQTQTENYVKATVYKVPTQTVIATPTIAQANQDVTYFDGLGRTLQQIGSQQSGSGKDVVKAIEYDAFGRQEKEYLPYAANTTGSLNYVSTALTDVKNFPQYTGQNPYSQKLFESSPVNRVLKQSAPGNLNDWALNSGHEIKFDYQSNIAGEVKLYNVITTWDPDKKLYNTTLGNNDGTVFYEPNQLYKTITYDENTAANPNEINGSTVEFKNKQNQIILKRTYESGVKHDTYYVYDDFGNLTYVLPPLSQHNPNAAPTGYNNFNQYFSQNVFTGAGGGGGVTVEITNNVLKVTFSAGFSASVLSTTPKDLATSPCLLPDIYLGTICAGGYSVVISGGKLKLNYISGGPVTGFNATLTYNLPAACDSQPSNIITQIPYDDISTVTLNSSSLPVSMKATNSIRLLDGFNAQAGSTFSAQIVTDGNVLDNVCYQYKYDQKNRIVEKKLPGKQWEFIVYDNLDRPVASGPANSPFSDLSTTGWLITKYDALNRIVYTGWENSPATAATRITKQNAQNALTGPLHETKSYPYTIDGVITPYTNTISPTSFYLLTLNYYDDYNFANAPSFPATLLNGQIVYYNNTTKPTGLATGTWTRVLTTKTSTAAQTSYTLYDQKERVIRTNTLNYLGGFTQIDYDIDFSGKTNTKYTTHQRANGDAQRVVQENFTFYPQGRLLKHTHKINGVEQLLAENQYDELGQLILKKVGNTTTNPLQVVDYTYNIRGWLKGINDSDTTNSTIIKDTKDLFGFKVNYNTPTTGTPLYNGNISQTFWKTSNLDTSVKSYTYTYDKLNRLTNAADNLNKFNETATYDKNGNIKTLIRMGEIVGGVPDISIPSNFGVMDNLIYTYDAGNKLQIISDSASDAYGFIDDNIGSGADTTTDYTYDANGNMLTDTNKGITTPIVYNHLNLPVKIVLPTGNISYIYNAAGQKLQKIVYSNSGASTTISDYLDGYQYEKINTGAVDLKFFPTAEGYVQPNGSSYKYFFQYKDHIGNVRLTYQDKQNDGIVDITDIEEENNYYPFGMKQKGYNNNASSNTALKYKYNGKEIQDELALNFYDFGARNYDPAIGRWMNIDPLAEVARRFSPYTYANNNPVFFIDPDGMIVINGDEEARNRAKEQKDAAQADFDSKSAGYDKKTATKEERKAYKESKTALKDATRDFNRAEAKYQHTQRSIDNFATIDPVNFQIANNLTYQNNAGETKNVDIVVKSGDASEFGGGKTGINPLDSNGNIPLDKIFTTIDKGLRVTSNVLGHELGHGVSIAASPLNYYNLMLNNPNHNCQDDSNRNSTLSQNARDWQDSYDRNYKAYKRANPTYKP